MTLFTELSVIVVSAALVAGLMRLLKQPAIVGYILAGVLLGPYFLNIFHNVATLQTLSEMGIAILLFIVGLHLSPKEIRNYGRSAFIIGAGQVLFTIGAAFVVSRFFGLSVIESLLLGVALSFSSTIAVLSQLADKRDLETLYGRIATGVLLFQDVIACAVLIVVSAASSFSTGPTALVTLLLKVVAVAALLILLSIYVLPKLSSFFAKSQEYLFLFSLAWGLGVGAVFGLLNLSIGMGALIAGIALSVSPYGAEISSKLKSLRDFFIVIFFILLGSQVSFSGGGFSLYLFFVMLAAVVLVLKPLSVICLAGALGYNKKTSFLSGISLAQISEFSMILMLLGYERGYVSAGVLSLVTLLGVLTIACSTYFISYAPRLYVAFARYLNVFERRRVFKEQSIVNTYDVVLFGCNRVGFDFVRVFKSLGSGFIAVDFDPDVVKNLQKEKISCMYGDAEDGDFLNDINIGKAKVVISTIPDHETNFFLLSHVRLLNKDSIVILISYNIDEAMKLYDRGATYVILPHFIGGETAAQLVYNAGFDAGKLLNKRSEHIRYLEERKTLGHTHPHHTGYYAAKEKK